ncbi:MAG: flagellar motor protein MotB [Defluviitaleaceae bacterium]|nr:flagellar motor protein MotB [Defluviitaleaceae bacterium]
MKKKKKQVSTSGKVLPGWMASYADMFTVLMAFFVLLFAMSVVDEELFQQFIDSFNPARAEANINIGQSGDLLIYYGRGIFPESPPPPPPGPGGEQMDGGEGGVEAPGDVIGDMLNTFATYMAENIPGEGADWLGPNGFEVRYGENFISITLPGHDGMLFNSGDARLLPSAIEALNFLGPFLRDRAAEGHGIVVEGHTDNQPINTPMFPSNWALSSMRASNVVEYLVDNWNISPVFITGSGRGEYFPVGDNNTVEGRAANRRVEIKVFERAEGSEGSGLMGNMWTIPR